MSLRSFEKRLGVAAVSAAAFTLALAAAGPDAHAAGPVSSTGKGIAGGALLGGELVTITMGAAGVERGWPYFVFGGVGMVGGGIGGFFVEKATTTTAPEAPLFMLAGGMVLVIPALVVSLNATAYKPPESDRTEPPGNEPAKDAPKPKPASARAKAAPRAASFHVPLSLVDLYRGKVALGVPALEVRPLYTQSELVQYGVAQGSEVRVPVFKATF